MNCNLYHNGGLHYNLIVFNSGKRQELTEESAGRKCYYCGLASHSRRDCPAMDVPCPICGKPGHFGSMCSVLGKTFISALKRSRNKYLFNVPLENIDLFWGALLKCVLIKLLSNKCAVLRVIMCCKIS